MSTIREKLGSQVRALRTARGLSQQALAEAAGLSVHSVSRLERGEQGASLEAVERIATALAVPVFKLFDFDRDYKVPAQAVDAIVAGLPADADATRQVLVRVLKAMVDG